MTLTIHLLNCGACGFELTGLSHDRVFYCIHCRTGTVFQEGDTRRLPVTFAEPELVEEGPILYLPFWKIRGDLRVDHATEDQQRIATTLNRFESIWVSAFLSIRKSELGDLGETLTEQRVTVREKAFEENESPLLVGTSRNIADALIYSELYLMALIDKRTDITGMSLSIDNPTAALWGFPFVDRGDHLSDLILGNKLQSATIPDLDPIRNIWRSCCAT